MYYHASQTPGIAVLEPRTSNHGVPLVYFSAKRENVLVYLCNSIEKYCRETGFPHEGRWTKWGPYGFTADGRLELQEYYPNALIETYRGAGGLIYSAEADGLEPLKGIPHAYVSRRPVPVAGCEHVPDAYAAILAARDAGLIAVRRCEDMTPAQLQWVHDTILREFREDPAADYRHFLLAKFPFLREE